MYKRTKSNSNNQNVVKLRGFGPRAGGIAKYAGHTPN